jgi:hypothetical protein
MAKNPRFPGDPVGGPSDRVHEGAFTDNSDAEGWKESPVADDKLVRNGNWKKTLSGSFDQPKFTDYAGGKSASYTKANKAALEFQGDGDDNSLPSKKGSRQNDWRGNK